MGNMSDPSDINIRHADKNPTEWVPVIQIVGTCPKALIPLAATTSLAQARADVTTNKRRAKMLRIACGQSIDHLEGYEIVAVEGEFYQDEWLGDYWILERTADEQA